MSRSPKAPSAPRASAAFKAAAAPRVSSAFRSAADKPKAPPAKPSVASSVTRGQLQGAATSPEAQKKVVRSNVLMSKAIVDKAKSWTHKTFGTTRKKIHKALAKDPTFLARKHATPENLKRMEVGKAPLAPKNEQLGKRVTMELDHKWERQDGVKENRVDNLRLVSPLTHKLKIMRKFYQAAGTEMPKDLRAAPKSAAKRGPKSL